MADLAGNARQSEPHEIHLVGVGVGHALTPVLHNFVAYSLNIPWRIIATECPTIEDCARLFRSPKQAGGVITMPWKAGIMQHLDHLDGTVKILQACNVMYLDAAGRLCGSNTDWIGIEGALRAAGTMSLNAQQGDVALVVGAGGAARAAVYALASCFGAKEIYVLNKDAEEVVRLARDCNQMSCSIVHVQTLEQAQGLRAPTIVISSVPDLEPKSPEEKAVRSILDWFLGQAKEKGVVLDMCYYPTPQTGTLRLAEFHGWKTIQGAQVVGHQVEAMWRYWVDADCLERLDRKGLWQTLHEAIALDPGRRQKLNDSIVHRHFGSP